MMKRLTIILFLFAISFSAMSQVRIVINKYLKDSIGGGIPGLWFDSAHNGNFFLLATRIYADSHGGGGGGQPLTFSTPFTSGSYDGSSPVTLSLPISVGTTSDSALVLNRTTGLIEMVAVSGGPTIYTGDGQVTSDRTVDLNGHFMNIGDANNYININPLLFTSKLYAGDGTGFSGVKVVGDVAGIGVFGLIESQDGVGSASMGIASDPSNGYIFELQSFGGSNIVDLKGDAVVQTISLTAANGLIYNTPPAGESTDSVMTWDAATGTVKARNASAFSGSTTIASKETVQFVSSKFLFQDSSAVQLTWAAIPQVAYYVIETGSDRAFTSPTVFYQGGEVSAIDTISQHFTDSLFWRVHAVFTDSSVSNYDYAFVKPYVYPGNFTYNPNIQMRLTNNSVVTNLDSVTFRTRYKVTGGVIYYVDGVNGSDGNAGTSPGAALKNIFTALAKTDINGLAIAAGTYDFNQAFVSPSQRINRNMTITSYGGPVYMGVLPAPTFAQDATYTNVYEGSTSTAQVLNMFDKTIKGPFGEPLRYYQASSIAECAQTAFSFFYASSVVYVNLPGFSASEINNKVMFGANSAATLLGTDVQIFVDSVNFIGTVQVNNVTSLGVSKFYAIRCGFFGGKAGSAGVNMDGLTESGLLNCKVMYSLGDGFSYKRTNSVNTHAFEQDVFSAFCGTNIVETGTNQNSTAHDTCQILRIRGVYIYAQTQNIADITAVKSINMFNTMGLDYNTSVSANLAKFKNLGGSSVSTYLYGPIFLPSEKRNVIVSSGGNLFWGSTRPVGVWNSASTFTYDSAAYSYSQDYVPAYNSLLNQQTKWNLFVQSRFKRDSLGQVTGLTITNNGAGIDTITIVNSTGSRLQATFSAPTGGVSVGTYSARIALSPADGNQFLQTDDQADAPAGMYYYGSSGWNYTPLAKENLAYFFDDLYTGNSTTSNGQLSSQNVNGVTLGSGAIVTASSRTAAVQTASLSTGTTTTGGALIRTGRPSASSGAYKLGSGAVYIKCGTVQFANLATGTDNYYGFFGLVNGATTQGTQPTSGVWFQYENDSSANWRMCTATSSTFTRTNTSTAVAAATSYTLGIFINAAGSSATFYINGSSVGTISTNIPTSTQLDFLMGLTKEAGTNARIMTLDYAEAWWHLNTGR